MHERIVAGVLALTLALAVAGCAASPSRNARDPAAQDRADPDSVARAFREVLIAADAASLQEFFADSVVFEGDARFVGAPQKAGRHTVSRDQLTTAFDRLFVDMGQAEWSGMIRKTQPSLRRAASDGEHHPLASAGDHVYSLALPGTSGPDDTLVFIFRELRGRLRVVAHYGDY